MLLFFGNKFKKIREDNRISIEKITAFTGISRATIWRWEKGKTTPNEFQIRQLAKAINVNLSLISNLENEKEFTEGQMSEIVESWITLADTTNKELIQQGKLIAGLLQRRENLLIQSSIIVRALLSSIESIFYLKDQNLKYITANSAFLANISFNEDFSVLGKTDKDFFLLKEAIENEDEDLSVIRTGNSVDKVERFIPGSRKKKWGIVSKTPILDSSGRIAGIVGTFIDITDRRKTEIKRIILEELLESIDNLVFVYDKKKDKILFVNSTAENLLGYSKNSFFEKKFWEAIVHEDDLELFYNIFTEKGLGSNLFLRILSINKELKYFKQISQVIKIINGREFYLSVLKDYTKIKIYEEQKEMLRRLLDTTDDVIGIFDITNNKDVYISESIKKLTGYPVKAFYKNPDLWNNKCIHPDDRKKRMNYIKTNSWPEKNELKIIKKSGEIVYCETTIKTKIVFGRKCLLWITRDITERKKQDEIKEILIMGIAKSNDAFCLCNMDTKRYIYFNKQYEEITGLTQKELLKNDMDYAYKNVPPEDFKKIRELFYSGTRPNSCLIRIKHPIRGTINVEINSKKTIYNSTHYVFQIAREINT